MAVSDGAMLPLGGTIDNTGTIALNSAGGETNLQLVGNGITLEGGGHLNLSDSAANVIFAATAGSTLTNVDNVISGAGQIGTGDGALTLVNETAATIDANIAGGILTLDTGNTIVNAGLLEASKGGMLLIDDPVSGSGNAVIAGGTIEFVEQASLNVIFNNGVATPAYGELVLGDASNFSGQISGFAGTEPNANHSDSIDLIGFNYASTTFSELDSNGNVVLTATDGSDSASLTFDNFNATLDFASDGNGGTLITDPPAAGAAATGASVAWGVNFSDDKIDFGPVQSRESIRWRCRRGRTEDRRRARQFGPRWFRFRVEFRHRTRRELKSAPRHQSVCEPPERAIGPAIGGARYARSPQRGGVRSHPQRYAGDERRNADPDPSDNSGGPSAALKCSLGERPAFARCASYGGVESAGAQHSVTTALLRSSGRRQTLRGGQVRPDIRRMGCACTAMRFTLTLQSQTFAAPYLPQPK